MSDVSTVIVGVVSVLSGVAVVTWLARPSEFRSVRVVSAKRRSHYETTEPRPASDVLRGSGRRDGMLDSSPTLARGVNPPLPPRPGRLSYYETARQSFAKAHIASHPTVVDQPTFFLRYSAFGRELGPFTASEKARLVANANSAVTLMWRQDDRMATPKVGRA